MFENRNITEKQSWCEQQIRFDPDSSPEAWEHYKFFYSQNEYLRNNYNFEKPTFYNCYEKVGLKRGYHDGVEWLNYVNKPLNSCNRLFVLQRGTKTKYAETEYIAAANRLGGDCDFNFNEKKYSLFFDIITGDITSTQSEKDNVTKQLERCRDKHHSLLNFSLMQAFGNMQKFKGSNRYDRLDTFVMELDKYYRGISNAVLRSSSPNNLYELISFLNNFNDVYEYCSTFYFITDKCFIDKIIEQGSMPITNVGELKRYMTLAEDYWEKKNVELQKMSHKEKYSNAKLSNKINGATEN